MYTNIYILMQIQRLDTCSIPAEKKYTNGLSS